MNATFEELCLKEDVGEITANSIYEFFRQDQTIDLIAKLKKSGVNMKLLQEKLAKYDAPQRAMAMGIYPYFREIQSDQDTEVLISGKKVLMFGSNAYLGLTNHPKVKEAAIEAIKKYGTGCAGSRFLNGTLDLHLQLEKRLAEFVGKEDAIVYSTGFQVNLGVVSCITGRA